MRLFFFSLNLLQARKALDACFEVFKNESEHRNLTRRAVMDKVCLVMLSATTSSMMREFFVDHIKEIMNIIEARFSKVFCRHVLRNVCAIFPSSPAKP